MQFPSPVRAFVGLLATAADEAKRFPDRAIELPTRAVSTALQLSLRAQQHYAQLAARGDQLLQRPVTGDDPPAWATFDDPGPDTGDAADAAETDAERSDVAAEPDTASGAHPTPDADTASGAGATPERARPDCTPRSREADIPDAREAQQLLDEMFPTKDSGKRVRKPRHDAPSRFDDVED